MVEEIQCVVCGQFPYKALECKSCNKLFCKYCQIQLNKGQNLLSNTTIHDDRGNLVDPRLQEYASAGRDGRGRDGSKFQSANMKKIGITPDFDVCCPNC
jgi:hypothetical protein